jgi:hypothetical protein
MHKPSLNLTTPNEAESHEDKGLASWVSLIRIRLEIFLFTLLGVQLLLLLLGQTRLALAGGTAFAAMILGSTQAPSQKPRAGWVARISACGLVGLALWGSLSVYDVSWDGQSYHQSAIAALAQGASPVWSPGEITSSHSLWINHYPAGAWLYGAALSSLGLPIEAAKSINFLVFFVALLSVAECVCKYSSSGRVARLLSALPLLACPLVAYQAFTSYNDGLVYLCLLLIGAKVVDLFRYPSSNARTLLLWLTLLASIKFTGAVYAGLIVLGVSCYVIAERRGREILATFRSLPGAGCILVCALAIPHPYLTNILRYSHPFYPVMGLNKIDFITSIRPENFREMDRFTAALFSVFSKSNAVRQPNSAELKWPGTLHPEELLYWSKADIEVGGFGPFFSLGLIASALCVCLMFYGRSSLPKGFWWLLGTSGSLAFVHSETWWARYVPSLWLFVALPLSAALLFPLPRSTKVVAVLGVLILLANTGLVALVAVRPQLRASSQLSDTLAELRGRSIIYAPSAFEQFPALAARLDVTATPIKPGEKFEASLPFSGFPIRYKLIDK